MKKKPGIGLILIFIVVFGIFSFPRSPQKTQEAQEAVKHRFEAQWLLEYLHPESGSRNPWKTLYLMYYRFPSPTFNYFIHIGSVFRDEKTDYIGIVGAAHDWTEWFYTYSAVAAGTKVEYLPEYRFDQDFNFKFLKDRSLIWTVGVTYIDYHLPANDLVISSGFMKYLKKMIWEYRLFRNRSNPGNIVSFTHQWSIGYGEEKKNWTYFNGSYGSQAYLAMYVGIPEEVRQKAWNLSLLHRKWISKTLGFEIELNYVNLKGGYKKYGIYSSVFLEL